MTPIRCIVEAALYIDDLDAAETFYRDVLGLACIGKEAGRHVFFQAGEQQVLLVFHAESTKNGDHLPPHGASRLRAHCLGHRDRSSRPVAPAHSPRAWECRSSESSHGSAAAGHSTSATPAETCSSS